MPRRRSRSPNDRISNRRPNFNSPQKRIGAQMSRLAGRFSRSPRRSRSPDRHQHSRPPPHPQQQQQQQQHQHQQHQHQHQQHQHQHQQQQRMRSSQMQSQRIGPDRSRNLNTASSFARTSRPPVKRSRSPVANRHRNSNSSTSPLNKKMLLRKMSPPSRAGKAPGRGGREKRISVSPNATRRKRTPPLQLPPPGRMETTVRRDTSRLTITSTLGHAKRDFGSPPRIRGHLSHSPVAMKKESQNDNKVQDRRAKPSKPFRNQLEAFQAAEKIGPGGDVIMAPVRNFRNEFASNVERENSPFRHDRRDMKRFHSGNLVDERVYAHARKNSERMFRVEKELMEEQGIGGIGGSAYDPEELKKITVDIRRNIPRDGEIIVRRITNPEEVVLVRRPEEGARPIFDRDEIKQEMHENFKVHRVNSYDAEAFQSRPSLSDRWQHDRKSAASANEKLLVSVRPGSPPPPPLPSLPPSQMIRKLANYRGRNTDEDEDDDDDDNVEVERLYRDMRTMAYRDGDGLVRLGSRDSDERHRDATFDARRPVPTNPHDLRHSLISRGRPIDLLDARQKILERQEREPAHHSYDTRKERGGSLERARPSGASWERNRERSREQIEGLPNFAARRDRYQYKEWIDKPDVVPKGPSYFEHDTRGEGNLEFRRGQGGFRGLGRGSTAFRSRGGAFRARGRTASFATNYVTRRIVDRGRTDQVGGLGKRSPHQWEHDMFEPADMKMDEDARPV